MLLQRGLLPAAGASRRVAAAAAPNPAAALRVAAAARPPAAAACERAAPLSALATALAPRPQPRLARCCSTSSSAAGGAGAAPGAQRGGAASAGHGSSGGEGQAEYLVINFYHLVDIPDTKEMMARQRAFLKGRDIRGRIYISQHGINCQAGGGAADARAYVEWIEAQPEFKGVRYSLWPAPGHVHPKLRLKERAGLISLAGGVDGLPVTDPAARATPLAPGEWREMLRRAEEANSKAQAGQGEAGGRVVVLDWAERPREEEFSETPVGDAELPAAVPCQLCGGAPAKLPHMNCANIECNELFVACEGCRGRWQGCCCESCMAAPRLLRPIKIDGHYARWTAYADEETMGPVMTRGRSEGRVARRRRRREALREKRAVYLEKKRELKRTARELLRAAEAARAAAEAEGGGGGAAAAAAAAEGGREAAAAV
ncbi:hypothetical protein Rsub_07032 [Raphidocelis subcapitata]|uniref:Rhodanese domain-containing protein n=1 Tax=Raphidocelis subcapitata TaxID=307507 RepID=A0A2V0P3R7_9CHLO|nr:hypothetical protein Rsub_07032 [Raphidocelis subcapitata]|eukprot:GBF94498.1 hypothetical protein Rsub_07032 [Raphidocelis subcapitata]